jgi:hypothetical protein
MKCWSPRWSKSTTAALSTASSRNDFVLEDNGVPQKIRVQEEMDTAPVALVVAVEEGGVSALEFDKLAKLGPLLDLFLSDGRSQAALVGFDSHPAPDSGLHPLQRRDRRRAQASAARQRRRRHSRHRELRRRSARRHSPSSFAACCCWSARSATTAASTPGRKSWSKKIGRSDVLVLSISFSPSRAEFLHDVKDSGDDRIMNPISSSP